MVVFLKPTFLQWFQETETWSLCEKRDNKRAFEIWSHAYVVLQRAQSEFDRTEIISCLKRSVDHRIRRLNEAYHLKRMPGVKADTGILERLEILGVIRPAMLNRLLTIRNAIEHQDAAPPPLETCADLVEFAWYFLRTTDRLALQLVERLSYNITDDSDDFSRISVSSRLTTGKEWLIELGGWVPEVEFSAQETAQHLLRIECEKTMTFAQFKTRHKWDEGQPLMKEFHGTRADTDVMFQGILIGPESTKLQIVRDHFDAL